MYYCKETAERNMEIYKAYEAGETFTSIALRFHLSERATKKAYYSGMRYCEYMRSELFQECLKYAPDENIAMMTFRGLKRLKCETPTDMKKLVRDYVKDTQGIGKQTFDVIEKMMNAHGFTFVVSQEEQDKRSLEEFCDRFSPSKTLTTRVMNILWRKDIESIEDFKNTSLRKIINNTKGCGDKAKTIIIFMKEALMNESKDREDSKEE